MEQLEVEKLVGELEIGVDRLRSLYEQYFMGIEKLEPAVPRKDVDRRIHLLRKEQIRNTALRFRFQMIIQRYNTYQTHWQRICREIENGTYKRHVMRANRRFENERKSTAPPQQRSSIPPRPSTAPPAAVHDAAGAGASPLLPPPAPLGFPQPGASLPIDLAAELADLERDFGPVIPAGPIRVATSPTRAVARLSAPSPPRAPAAPGPPPPARPPLPQPNPTRVPAPPAVAAAPIPPRAPAPTPPRPVPPARPAPGPVAGPAAPPPTKPAAPPAVTPTAAAPAPRPPARADGDLPDHRVRAIYEQYVEAKRRQKESTAAITYDAIAKTLRESSAKLREKHGKSVDFEVAVRDGKAILKPVIK